MNVGETLPLYPNLTVTKNVGMENFRGHTTRCQNPYCLENSTFMLETQNNNDGTKSVEVFSSNLVKMITQTERNGELVTMCQPCSTWKARHKFSGTTGFKSWSYIPRPSSSTLHCYTEA